MNNRLVYEPSSKIREVARNAMQGHWGHLYLGMLIYFGLTTVVSTVLDTFFTVVRYVQLFDGRYYPMEYGYAGGLYEFVVAGAMLAGLYMFLLAFFRSKKIDYGLTLEGFGMFGKCFVLYLLYAVKIALWTMLFIVPGIIASFRYSMAFMLRVDNPEWTANRCISESSRLMRGNKGKLFCLNLSFIGWYFLAALPTSVIMNYTITSSGIGILALSVITALPLLVVNLYSNMAVVAFYEILIGNLVIMSPNYEYQNNGDPYQGNYRQTYGENQGSYRQTYGENQGGYRQTYGENQSKNSEGAKDEEPADSKSADDQASDNKSSSDNKSDKEQ